MAIDPSRPPLAQNMRLIQRTTYADLPAPNPTLAGTLAWVEQTVGQDPAGLYLCKWQSQFIHEWAFVPQNSGAIPQAYDEVRRTWVTNAEPLIVNNLPTANMRTRYPILPLTDFSSDITVSAPTLELDVTGNGPVVTLVYGTDWALLPRTPQVTGAPGLGIGYGMQSWPAPAGPHTAIAQQAVGFGVSQGIAQQLTPNSVFTFSWNERILRVEARGAMAAVIEIAPGVSGQPSYSAAYAMGHGVGAQFPNSPQSFIPGQYGIWFPPLEGARIEIWRRAGRTRAGKYRDRGNHMKGLRRGAASMVPYDRLPAGKYYALSSEEFQGLPSRSHQFAWCYWDDVLQARSRISQETIFRTSRQYQRITGSLVFRSGYAMWVGLR